MPPDDSALLAQVREALDAQCGCIDIPQRLRYCPTCLPERIAAAIDDLAGMDVMLEDGIAFKRRAALAVLRGER